ncbi:MAG: sulfatase-like hydrolase/transferase, partial [Firmicutes bacterium]|nr:sulfatase-like hydrolase/transferase [Bacillota bacterium]
CTFLTGWIGSRVVNRIGSIIVMAAVWLFYASQLVYYNVFGSMFSVSMVGVAGDAMTDFGWALKATLRDTAGAIAVSLIPLILFALLICLFGTHFRYGLAVHGGALVLTAALWLCAAAALPLGGTADNSAYNAYHSRYIDTDTASSKLGVLANSAIEAGSMAFGGAVEQPEEEIIKPVVADERDDCYPIDLELFPNRLSAIDFTELAGKTTSKDIKTLCDYLSGVQPTNRNDMTGYFRGYNLIYICAEAFSCYALDENVTPTLSMMSQNGIVLNNFYNSFKNTTTNGEYAFLTSLWPDVSRDSDMGSASGTMAKSASRLMPLALGNVFNRELGISSRGYHNYKGSYYSRDKSLPNMGFTCKFMNDGMKFSTNWPSSDYEMMQQSVPDYVNDEEQFCTYYMTFSGHGYYGTGNAIYDKNYNTVKGMLGDRAKQLTGIAAGYLANNYELDKAMAYLLEELEKAGKLDNTVIVLIGDHYPYYLFDGDCNSLAGHKVDKNFEMYKSTCIIYNAGMKEPLYVDDYCCTVDILPTIYNLFDVDYDSRLLAGRDIFSDTTHFAMIYNKNFVTEEVKYNSSSGKATWSEGCTMTDEEKAAYLSYYIDLVKSRYSMSLKIESTDFLRFVWENSGLSN